jgi:hypothetical protein
VGIDRGQIAIYFRRTLKEVAADRLLYVLLAVYCAIALSYVCVIGSFDGQTALDLFSVYGAISLMGYCVTFPFFLAIANTIGVILRLPRRRALAFRLMLDPRQVSRLVAGTMLMMAMIPFRALFNVVKVTIPHDGGFAYDRLFADVDKALHFGIDPFRLVHAFGENAWVLRAIELNYNNVWFLITFGALYAVVVSRRFASIRIRFVTCFVLAWAVNGTLLAVLGSSAGPAFYGLVTGDFARFADLLDLVDATRGQPGSAADFHDYLWDMHVHRISGVGSGISAFPSVHVTIITMLALFISEQMNRRWAIAAWGYVGLTVASSVYLGWHYAIDGYVAIAVATTCHLAVKALMTSRFRWSTAAAAARPAST